MFFFLMISLMNMFFLNNCFIYIFMSNKHTVFAYIILNFLSLKGLMKMKFFFFNLMIKPFLAKKYFFFFKFIYLKICFLSKLMSYSFFMDWFFYWSDFSMYSMISSMQLCNIYSLIVIVLMFIFLLSLTMWTSASGPSTSVDQLHYLTWKEILMSLFMMIMLLIILNMIL